MFDLAAWQWIGLAAAAAVAIACAVPWSRLAAWRQSRQPPEPSADGPDALAADVAAATECFRTIRPFLADATAEGIRKDFAEYFAGRFSAIAVLKAPGGAS